MAGALNGRELVPFLFAAPRLCTELLLVVVVPIFLP